MFLHCCSSTDAWFCVPSCARLLAAAGMTVRLAAGLFRELCPMPAPATGNAQKTCSSMANMGLIPEKSRGRIDSPGIL